MEADSRRELIPSTWVWKRPSVFDHLGENSSKLLKLARDEGAVALVCLRATQGVGDRLVGHDDRAVGNGDRHCIRVVHVVLCPTPLVVAVDSELQIDGYLHARQKVEEFADELPTLFRILLSEAAGEPSDGKSVLLKDPDQQVEVLVDDLACLDPDPKLSWVVRWGVDKQADELALPLKSTSTCLGCRFGLVPVTLAQELYFVITRARHHLILEALGCPYPHLTGELFGVDEFVAGVVDSENLLHSFEDPMHTHTERFELLRTKRRPTEALVHRHEELIAKKVSARPDSPEVRDRGHHVREIAPLSLALDRRRLDVVGPREGERHARVRCANQGLKKVRVARGIRLSGSSTSEADEDPLVQISARAVGLEGAVFCHAPTISGCDVRRRTIAPRWPAHARNQYLAWSSGPCGGRSAKVRDRAQ